MARNYAQGEIAQSDIAQEEIAQAFELCTNQLAGVAPSEAIQQLQRYIRKK